MRYWIRSKKELLKEILQEEGFPRGNSEPSKTCHFED
jgi:hypothetical protein